MLHRLTVAASGRHSPVCISQWPLSQSHSVKKCRCNSTCSIRHKVLHISVNIWLAGNRSVQYIYIYTYTQYTVQYISRTTDGVLARRPAHLSCGLSCVRLMAFAAACVDRFGLHRDVIRPQGHSSRQRILWHHAHYCGSGCGNVSARRSLFLWESVICIEHFDKWSGGETKRTFDMSYDGQMTYSGSQRGCSPSSLGGSDRSNDPQPPGGTDSCGWEDGRWSEWKLARIHTSDSPDSWRNQSSPPRWHEWRTLLEPSIWLFKFILKHTVVNHLLYISYKKTSYTLKSLLRSENIPAKSDGAQWRSNQ